MHHQIHLLILPVILFCFPIAAKDLIIDKQGNEIEATILSTDSTGNIQYQSGDSSSPEIKSISRQNVFMIKYENGKKEVFPIASKPAHEPPLAAGRFGISLLANVGVFGLFNVDNDFTKSSYTIVGTPVIEYQINRIFTIGTEVMLMFGKPETKDALRFIIDPNIRAKAGFPLHKRVLLEPVIAAGMSIWPESDGTAYLDSTLLDSRFGWHARAALELDVALSPKLSIIFEAGYSASSSESKGVWITHDMMLVGVGPKLRF